MAIVYEIGIGDIDMRDAQVTSMIMFGSIIVVDSADRDTWYSTPMVVGNSTIGYGTGLWTRSSSRKIVELSDVNGTIPNAEIAYETWPFRRSDIGKIFLKKPLNGASPSAGKRLVFDYMIKDVS